MLPLAVALGVAILAPASATGEAAKGQGPNVERQVGYAYAQGSQKQLYTEVRYLRREQGRPITETVVHCSPDGGVQAVKTLDYRTNPQAPDFRFAMSEDRYLEGVRTESQGRRVFVKPVGADKVKEASLPADAGLVIDAGLERLLEANIARLEGDKPVTFPFLIPSRLKAYSLRIRPVGHTEVLGRSTIQLRVEATNAAIKMVTKPIEIYFQPEEGRVVRFWGLSNQRDKEGWNLGVRVDYPRPPTPEEAFEDGEFQGNCPLKASLLMNGPSPGAGDGQGQSEPQEPG